jgi:hypothetical protein
MPRVTMLQTNFTAGEISPRLLGRTDIARYQNGAKILENCYPLVQGGVIRRPGLRYVAAAKFADKKVRLIPYTFNKDQAYILEFGHLYMRVYKDGAQVLTGGSVPYEIVTPYGENELADLNYAQGADTMFIAHPSFPIYRLRRQDHADWSLAPAPFVTTPFDEIGYRPTTTLTLSSGAVGTGRTLTAGAAHFQAADVGREVWANSGVAKITAVASGTSATADVVVAFSSTSIASEQWQIRLTPQTTCTPTAKDPVGTIITLTLGAAGWRADDVGKFVSINRGLCQITAYTSSVAVQAKILTALDATVASPANAWVLMASVWNARDGYPAAVSLNEQRLVAAGSPGYPQTVWMSRIGEYLNFELGTRDDDALSFTVASDQINPVQHIGQIKSMLVLTGGGEFSLQGGVEKPVTATNVQVKNQSNYGCSNVRPVRIGNELLYIQRAGRKLRASSYKVETDAFASPDLSVLGEHATLSGIKEMAYQQEPDSVIWLIRNDGVLVSVTIERDQDVIGWARHSTDGTFESCACIPIATGDQIWVVTNRSINGAAVKYIERMTSNSFTDCSLKGTSGPGVAVWTGLNHLEGETVSILADGVVMPDAIVTGGQITLSRPAFSVDIGLPFIPKVKLLTPEIGTGTGSAQGNSMRVSEVTIRLVETIGAEVNGQVIAFRQFGEDVLDNPVDAYTGDHRIEVLGWDRGKTDIEITQPQPLPFHLLCVIMKLTVND